MGKIILEYFDGNRIYVCTKCHIHISNYKSRISKNFRGGIGQAFLFEKGINYHVGQPEDKDLMTGKHIVQDVICNGCNKVIGWKYVFRIVLIHQLDQSVSRVGEIQRGKDNNRKTLYKKNQMELILQFIYYYYYMQKYLQNINQLVIKQNHNKKYQKLRQKGMFQKMLKLANVESLHLQKSEDMNWKLQN